LLVGFLSFCAPVPARAGELARINLGSPSYGTPVAANGTLFVASQQYLWAVQSGARPAAE